MGIQARSNELGVTRQYTDSTVTTTTTQNVLKGTTTTSQSTSSSIRHRCERSPLRRGQLKRFGNRQVRLSTDYVRRICDLTDGAITEETKTYFGSTLTQVRTRVYPVPAEWSTWDLLSPSIGGYTLIESSDARNEAITKCMNNLGDQKVALGTALAEMRKTVDMIADTGTNLLHSYRSLRRGDIVGALKAVGLSKSKYYSGKSAANALLSLKYGWVPLMSDLKDSHDYLKSHEETPLFLEAFGSAKRSAVTDHPTGDFDRTVTVNQKSRVVVKAMLEVPGLHEANRLGLTNPLSIVWELVPYSFVVDWMLPIGNTLQAYSDATGLTFVDGYHSTKNEASIEIRGNSVVTKPTSSTERVMSGDGIVRYFSHSRTAYSGFPRPAAYIRQGWLNTKKVSTFLALLRGSYR